MIQDNIKQPWKALLKDEFSKDYFIALTNKLNKDEAEGHIVLPPIKQVFEAINITPFNNIKAVIIGQDPYHNIGQAHGLSFSVNNCMAIPPSLKNIFKELQSDVQFKIPTTGNLSAWAKQGVLLLNTSLTVQLNKPNAHKKYGWNNFTDKIIELISEQKEHVVFILWGNDAKNKIKLIDTSKHLILQAVHPSPLSANRGFFGCKHFSKTNKYLQSKNIKQIDWQL